MEARRDSALLTSGGSDVTTYFGKLVDETRAGAVAVEFGRMCLANAPVPVAGRDAQGNDTEDLREAQARRSTKPTISSLLFIVPRSKP